MASGVVTQAYPKFVSQTAQPYQKNPIISNPHRKAKELMGHPGKMQNDITSSLSEICHKSNADLISRLLDIQEHVTLGKKSIQWAMKLRCLCWVHPSRISHRTAGDRQDIMSARTLRRNRIFICQPRESYVAVSCPWRLPKDESYAQGGYCRFRLHLAYYL